MRVPIHNQNFDERLSLPVAMRRAYLFTRHFPLQLCYIDYRCVQISPYECKLVIANAGRRPSKETQPVCDILFRTRRTVFRNVQKKKDVTTLRGSFGDREKSFVWPLWWRHPTENSPADWSTHSIQTGNIYPRFWKRSSLTALYRWLLNVTWLGSTILLHHNQCTVQAWLLRARNS